MTRPVAGASRSDAIRALAIDRLAAEIVTLLTARGIEVILLKGSPLGRWLHPPGWVRPSADVDLLVPPSGAEPAATVLAASGWVERPNPAVVHATTWHKSGIAFPIDLHTTFHFVTVSEAAFWSAVARDADVIELCGATVRIPSTTTALTLLGLHAAAPDNRAVAEFELALASCSDEVISDALELADELGALDALAVSLRRSPRGVAVAEDRSLASTLRESQALRMQTMPRTAAGFRRLDEAATPLGLAWRLAREVVPGPRQIRRCYPRLAAIGPAGLVLGYLWRPFDVVRRSPQGWAAWRQLNRRIDVSVERRGSLSRLMLASEVAVGYLGSRLALRRAGVAAAVAQARRPLAGFHGRVMQSPSADISAGRRLDRVVDRALRHFPGDTRCLIRSLVLVRLLANRGIEGRLVLALRRHDRLAHAWVEIGGHAVSTPADDGFVTVTTL